MENDQRTLISLGEEAKLFLTSTLGIYLSECAKAEVGKAYVELANVPPEDPKKIRELQNIIKRHDSFDQWILEAIDAGDTSYGQYLEEGE